MPPVLLPVSHFEQRSTGECLAAGAAMLLTYLEIPITYDQLLQILRIEWFGAPASHIRYLEKLGVVVTYKQGDLVELHQQLWQDRPCIAFVQTGELPYWAEDLAHAVVVVGLDDKNVFLNDPAWPDAPMQVARGDFELAWLARDEFYAVITQGA